MAARILRRKKAAQDAEEIANYIAKDSLESAARFLKIPKPLSNVLLLLPVSAGSSILSIQN